MNDELNDLKEIFEQNSDEKLYQKLKNEYDNFVKQVKEKGVDEVVDRAYEIAIKKELIYAIADRNILKNFEQDALLKDPNLLDTFYQEWLHTDSDIDEIFEYPIDEVISNSIYNFRKEEEEKLILKLYDFENENMDMGIWLDELEGDTPDEKEDFLLNSIAYAISNIDSESYKNLKEDLENYEGTELEKEAKEMLKSIDEFREYFYPEVVENEKRKEKEQVENEEEDER